MRLVNARLMETTGTALMASRSQPLRLQEAMALVTKVPSVRLMATIGTVQKVLKSLTRLLRQMTALATPVTPSVKLMVIIGTVQREFQSPIRLRVRRRTMRTLSHPLLLRAPQSWASCRVKQYS